MSPPRAAAESWGHIRYWAELVTQEASDRTGASPGSCMIQSYRATIRLALDLNRNDAPLRGKIRELLRGEFLAGATNVCLIGRPGRGKSHVMAALHDHLQILDAARDRASGYKVDVSRGERI